MFWKLAAMWSGVVGGCLLAACGPRVPPLEHTYETPAAVADAVLSALANRDLVRLRAIAVDEREVADHVWPDLPAARPERNLPLAFVWGDLQQKSESALTEILARHGGRRYALVALRFLGGSTPYRSYVVHRKTELVVREASGATRAIRVFGSLLAQGQRLKVFSYVVD